MEVSLYYSISTLILLVLLFVVTRFNNVADTKVANSKVIDSNFKNSLSDYIKLYLHNTKWLKQNRQDKCLKMDEFKRLELVKTILPFYRLQTSPDETVIANKNCTFLYYHNEVYDDYFLCKDKKTGEGFKLSFKYHQNAFNNDNKLKIFFEKYISSNFSYETKYETIKNIVIKQFEKYMLFCNWGISDKININIASVAELTVLPGINIGKANKIVKHIRNGNRFNTIDEFTDFADISIDDVIKIKKLFNENNICL